MGEPAEWSGNLPTPARSRAAMQHQALRVGGPALTPTAVLLPYGACTSVLRFHLKYPIGFTAFVNGVCLSYTF